MISFSNKIRSTQDEIMDDFDLKGPEMEVLLTDLKRVNTLLGGCSITRDGIKKLLKNIPREQQVSIIDLGCGDGEMLRSIAHFGIKKGYNFQLIGIDANGYILKEARKRSLEYNNITFRQLNVFSEEFLDVNYDIALCTLFLHHFNEAKIKSILQLVSEQAKVGVVINDLERNIVAFQLFKLFSLFFIRTRIAKHDGLVSVARSFKKKELVRIANQLKGVTSSIQWKWAFRWQWILSKDIKN